MEESAQGKGFAGRDDEVLVHGAGMMDTKERIFWAAVDLSSRKGFDAVSMRELAREVGIRESSIYNHYRGKEAILDAILSHFASLMESVAPEGDEIELIREHGFARFFTMGTEQLIGRAADPASFLKIWRIIAIELYRNKKMRDFFEETMMDGPFSYWEGLFSRAMDAGIIPRGDARLYAEELFSYALYFFFEAFVLRYEEDPLFFARELSPRMERHIAFILGATEQQSR
jgi:AcrR family transcriptional regulator